MENTKKTLKQIIAEKNAERFVAEKIAQGKAWDSGKKYDAQTASTESKWSAK